MNNVGKTVLKGHGLRNEGIVQYDQNGQWVFYPQGSTSLHAKCRCGALSPAGVSQNAAKQWHREHKDSLR